MHGLMLPVAAARRLIPKGIGQVIEYQLSPTELAKMHASAEQLSAVLKEI